MLPFLGKFLEPHFGPFRLFSSHLFLLGLGMMLGFLSTFIFLPRLTFLLPSDRGRAHAIDAKKAKGKPTGAGFVFINLFLLVLLLVLPLNLQTIGIVCLTFLAMMSGWLDDKSEVPWGQYKKAVIDLILALVTVGLLTKLQPMIFWFPFTAFIVETSPWISLPLGSVLIWLSINCTNCSDGVDGLSGTLAAIALTSLGGLFYFVLGHQGIANYLLVPHNPMGSIWAIVTFSMVGTIMAYLWYNAYPSQLLMGDAGSRAIGFLIGVLVFMTGNPFLLLIVSGMLLINGGTGIAKIALLRFMKIRIFQNVRFPLHDHVRHKLKWSAPQVLLRFASLQVIFTLFLLLLLLKVR